MASFLEATFPRLTQDNYSITSQPSKRYNCIGWAAGDNAKWWWPGPDVEFEYWPENARRAETVDAFQEALATVGYAICDGADFEPGFEKVALFADERARPTHAARQLPSGRWTSKLGALEDIEHALSDLEGSDYGKVSVFMKRPALI
jgi:hypothetical protein